MNPRSSLHVARANAGCHGFSLVEVALALGIFAFALVAVLGTLPISSQTAREGMAGARAAQIAESLFASFRAQPFNAVCYVDAQFDPADGNTPSGTGPSPIDLRQAQTPAGIDDATAANVDNQFLRFYAQVVETDSQVSAGDPVRMHYGLARPAEGYQIVLHFTAAPSGVTGKGLVNRIDMKVSALDRPGSVYPFTSTLANRAGTLDLSQL